MMNVRACELGCHGMRRGRGHGAVLLSSSVNRCGRICPSDAELTLVQDHAWRRWVAENLPDGVTPSWVESTPKVCAGPARASGPHACVCVCVLNSYQRMPCDSGHRTPGPATFGRAWGVSPMLVVCDMHSLPRAKNAISLRLCPLGSTTGRLWGNAAAPVT